MAKVLIASPDRSDRATITAGSEVSSMPATNLFRLQPSDVWRATDLGAAYLVVDRAACADGGPQLLALLYANLSATAELRIRAAATEDALTAGSPPLDLTVAAWAHANYAGWPRVHTFAWLGDGQQDYRWWRIDVSDPDNPAGYVQAGRLYLVAPFVPTLNLQFGWSPAYLDPSTSDVVQGGATFPVERARRRAFRVPLIAGGDNAQSEFFDGLFALQRYRGSSRDVLLMIDRDNAARLMDWSIYGLLSDLQPLTNSTFNLWEHPMTVTEIEHP